MPSCAAVNCTNRPQKGVRLFRFPADDVRREQWVCNLRRKSWVPTKSSYLCEKHFEESQFENGRADNWRKLKPNAVPTLFGADTRPTNPPVIKTEAEITESSIAKSNANETTEKDKHFEESQCESGQEDNWSKLKPNAAPTLFLLFGVDPVPNNPVIKTEVDISEHSIAESNANQTAKKDIAQCAMLEHELEHLQKQLNTALAAKGCLERDNEVLHKQLNDLKTAVKTFLNNDQIEMLQQGRLAQWSNEAIIKGLKLRFALSVNGYNYLRSTGYPLPAYCTIMRRVQDLKLNFGIFDDVLQLLRFKVEMMDSTDRYCSLSYDEMVISEQADYDKSSGKFHGFVTLGGISDVVGTKIFLVLLRGVKTPWKQVIACHVMPKESIDVQVLKEFFLQCISSVEDCGFHILALTSDNKNKSLWNSLGINIHKSGPLVNSFMFHEHEIFAIPDVCHILKNLKSAVLKQKIYLPDAFVEHEGLSTNIVDGTYIKSLWHDEVNNSGKEDQGLHHLRIDPSQFDKMNLGAAIRFFSPKTANALEIAVKEKSLPENALTTAAFIRLIYKWFSLVSSQARKASITLKNCDEKYIFLHRCVDIFRETIFEKNWKPLNYALVLSTSSFCDIVKFLFKKEFDFVLGHHFMQNATENIFSQIRNKEGKMPTALKCLRAIKSISVSQFVSNVERPNYCNDSDNFLLNFCNSKKLFDSTKAVSTFTAAVDETNISDEIQICTVSLDEFSSTVSDCDAKKLFYLAGCITNAIMKHICEHCIAFVLRKNLPDNDFIQKVKQYTSALKYDGLNEPCLEMFYLILHCDYVFKTYRDHIFKYGNVTLIERLVKYVNIVFPSCCDVKTKIVKHFFNVRCSCTKNFVENGRKRKNVNGTASLKRSKA